MDDKKTVENNKNDTLPTTPMGDKVTPFAASDAVIAINEPVKTIDNTDSAEIAKEELLKVAENVSKDAYTTIEDNSNDEINEANPTETQKGEPLETIKEESAVPKNNHDITEGDLANMPLGLQLRTVREQKQISLDTVKQQIKIPAKWLEAIEESRWHELKSTTYVRSYLRDYAKILGINIEKEVNETFPINTIGTEAIRTIVPMSPRSIVMEQPATWAFKQWFILFFILLLFASVFLIYQYTSSSFFATNGQDFSFFSSSPSKVQGKELSLPSNIMPTHKEPKNNDDHSKLETEKDNVISDIKTTDSSNDDINEGGSILVEKVNGETEIAVATTTIDAATAVDEVAPYTLILKAKAQSWIQLSSAANGVLMEHLLEKGDVVSYPIKPPFLLIVGNALLVDGEYNGELLSFEQHLSKNGVARITKDF